MSTSLAEFFLLLIVQNACLHTVSGAALASAVNPYFFNHTFFERFASTKSLTPFRSLIPCRKLIVKLAFRASEMTHHFLTTLFLSVSLARNAIFCGNIASIISLYAPNPIFNDQNRPFVRIRKRPMRAKPYFLTIKTEAALQRAAVKSAKPRCFAGKMCVRRQ